MKKIKKILKKGLAAGMALTSLFLHAVEGTAAEYWPEQPETESPCVIVMEASTCTVLYEKNIHEQHYPASITKIMTACIALEHSELDEVVTFSRAAAFSTDGSSIARDEGEEMTMEQCLYAMMLESSNECAYAIAEHVGGTYDHFVEMMNEKAKELGCKDTHFNNPHGLNDTEHYTSCYDMALISAEAWKNEDFRRITGTPSYAIPPTNKHPNETTYLSNHNKLLHEFNKVADYIYPYCVGGKTGYTNAANSTLVTYAQKNGMTLICVIMNTNAPLQWTDSIRLYDFYLNNFKLYRVSDYETRFESNQIESDILDEVSPFVSIAANSEIVLPISADFTDTEAKLVYDYASEDILASIQYTYGGRSVGRADIIRSHSMVPQFEFDSREELSTENSEEVRKIKISIWQIASVFLGIIALVFLIIIGKKFADNFYIIKHKYFSRPKRDKRYKTIKANYRRQRKRKFQKRR